MFSAEVFVLSNAECLQLYINTLRDKVWHVLTLSSRVPTKKVETNSVGEDFSKYANFFSLDF